MLGWRAWRFTLALAAASLPSFAHAQTAEEFFGATQLRLIVGNPPGGDYDLGGRLLAKYMSKYIPGNRAIIVENMPGASTIAAANYLFNKAPRDGSTFGSFSRNLPSQAVLGQTNIQADPRLFSWLGASSLPSRVCVARSSSPVQAATDLFSHDLIVAGAGAGSSLSIIPTVLNKVLGTKFKLVEGYAGAAAAILALQRGEVEGICHTYGLFQTTDASLVKDGSVRILLHMEETPLADAPNIPSVYAYAPRQSQQQFLRFAFSSVEFGRPYVAPPEVPTQRLAVLRKAFAAALKDPALRNEAAQMGLDMTYRPPDELSSLVGALYDTPKEIVDEAQAIMPAGNGD